MTGVSSSTCRKPVLDKSFSPSIIFVLYYVSYIVIFCVLKISKNEENNVTGVIGLVTRPQEKSGGPRSVKLMPVLSDQCLAIH